MSAEHPGQESPERAPEADGAPTPAWRSIKAWAIFFGFAAALGLVSGVVAAVAEGLYGWVIETYDVDRAWLRSILFKGLFVLGVLYVLQHVVRKRNLRHIFFETFDPESPMTGIVFFLWFGSVVAAAWLATFALRQLAGVEAAYLWSAFAAMFPAAFGIRLLNYAFLGRDG